MSPLAYRVDGQSVETTAFYALACDPARSVVVEACAGAGKTWMLVARLLRALLNGVPPEQIVAITFTRKAAAEMRDRLWQLLDELAQASEPARIQALTDRGVPLAQARMQADQLLGLAGRLRAAPQGVAVYTFHAWFAQLLRGAPASVLGRLGLSPELQLLDDERSLVRPLWRRLHRAVSGDPGLQADYLGLAARHGRAALEAWLEAAWSKRVEIERAGPAWIDAVPAPDGMAEDQDGAELIDAWRSEFSALAIRLGQAKGKRAQDAATKVEQALNQPSPAQRYAALRLALCTAEGAPRQLGDVEGHLALCDRLDLIDAVRRQQAARRDHQALCRLSAALLDAWSALKRERGVVDMSDLEQGACALLAQDDAAAWLQQRLDMQVRLLLVDEFQDTSPLQWQALSGWLSSYSGAGAGRAPSVFLVGDPKQSIYRFRRAEPRVFAHAQRFVVDGLGGHLLDCDHTRRNGPAVRDAVNRCFERLTRSGRYTGFRAHTGPETDPPWAGLWALDAPGAEPPAAEEAEPEPGWRASLTQPRREPELARRQPEAERVAELVAQLLNEPGASPGSVMVLARKRSGLTLLADALRQRGIPSEINEEQPLLDVPVVQDVVALLDVLASPDHNLALAQVLRSALFEACSGDLMALCDAAAGRSWSEALAEGSWDAHPALARAGALWRQWQRDLLDLPPLEALTRIVRDADLAVAVASRLPPSDAEGQLAALDALLAQALELQAGRFWTLYGFVRALRERAPSWQRPISGHGVRLLTVHGAKGLEADTVVLLDTDAPPPRAQTQTLLVDWPVDSARPRCVAFVASESRPPPLLQPLMDEERDQRLREELNGLYVALTRARHRVIVSRTKYTRGGSDDSWWQLLAMEERPCWTLQTPTPLPPSTVGQRVWRLPTWSAPERVTVPSNDAADPRAAALGEALHRVLEWATQPQASGQRATWCAAAAQMYALDSAAVQALTQAVDAVLDSPETRAFMGAEPLLWAGNEVAVVHEEQELRLDRLVLCPALPDQAPTWWVLDFKLNPAPLRQPEYLAQMARYRAAVANMQPGEPVRGAFISADGRLHVSD